MLRLKNSLTTLFLSFALVGFVLPGSAASEERLVGTQFDSRVLLGFAVPEAAAQAMMPEGWKVLTLPQGPLTGANLLVVLMDRHLSLDPEGNPANPSTVRAAVLVNFGIQPGAKAPQGFVTRVYITDVGNDPYGVSVPATVARDSALDGPAGAPATRHERWEIIPESGGSFSLSLSHTAGIPVLTAGETLSYSPVDPDFYHIYRYQQLGDLAMSEGLGKPLSGEVSFSVDIPELAPLFDGSERLVTVISLPWYWRDLILP